MTNQKAAMIVVMCSCIVYFCRSLPWLLFGKKGMPAGVQRLADLLPPALMATLVVYSLKALPTSDGHTALAMAAGSLVTACVHIWKKNQIFSVLVGTVFYVVLLNFF